MPRASEASIPTPVPTSPYDPPGTPEIGIVALVSDVLFLWMLQACLGFGVPTMVFAMARSPFPSLIPLGLFLGAFSFGP